MRYSASNKGVTMHSQLEAIQGHWKWYHSKAWVRFPIHIPQQMPLAVSTQYTNVTVIQPIGVAATEHWGTCPLELALVYTKFHSPRTYDKKCHHRNNPKWWRP